MLKKFLIILLIQLLTLAVIGFKYIPIDTPIFTILPIFSFILSFFIGFIGLIFGFVLLILNHTKKYKSKFRYIYIWLFYVILLFIFSTFSVYLRDSLEIFNTDRGDVLTPLPLFQQNLGFYLYSLLFTIPLTVLILSKNPQQKK